MKILGVVAEYNPFHNGHLYHFQQSLKKIKPDYSICLLASNFLQRGEPSLTDKWSRASMAIKAGFDLVLELPIFFSTRSAQYYSFGAVELFNKTGLVNYLSFGAETADLENLSKLAKYLNKNPKDFQEELKIQLKEGKSYPKARAIALEKNIGFDKNFDFKELNNPNNILALSYLEALDKSSSSIQPVIIKRENNYHSLTSKDNLASATAIRNAIKEKKPWTHLVPDFTSTILDKEFSLGKGPIYLDDLSQIILSLIRKSQPEELSQILEMKEGIENRIFEKALQATSINHLLGEIKTKRYTLTYLQRLLIYILLSFKDDPLFYQNHYLRVLAFKKESANILSILKKESSLPIIANFSKSYKANPHFRKCLDLEILATDLYKIVVPNKLARTGRDDFFRSPIIL